jgi:hypothetical protein
MIARLPDSTNLYTVGFDGRILELAHARPRDG